MFQSSNTQFYRNLYGTLRNEKSIFSFYQMESYFYSKRDYAIVQKQLCFNCLEELEVGSDRCGSCGVEFIDTRSSQEITDKPADGIVKLDQMIKDEITAAKQKNRYDDHELLNIVLISSFIGLLQISFAPYLDLIYQYSLVFTSRNIAQGSFLLVSGFIYFLLIPLTYVRYNMTRNLLLLLDITSMYILMRAGQVVGIIRNNIQVDSPNELSPIITDFLEKSVLIRFLLLLFSILYALHIVFLFKRELNVKRSR